MGPIAALAAGLLLAGATEGVDRLKAERGCARAPKPVGTAPATAERGAAAAKARAGVAERAVDGKRLVRSRCPTPAQRWTPGSF